MPLYFLVYDAERFHQAFRPALAAAWKQRSFEPCRRFCVALLPEVRSFQERYHAGEEEPLLAKVTHGLSFDRQLWRLLVGEILLYAAAEIPEIATAPDTLACLLGADRPGRAGVRREGFAPIQRAHFGTHDLTFGSAFYQPERTGYNDVADVARLADYLQSVEPDQWTEGQLLRLSELATTEDRLEELETAREWFPALRDLYVRVRERRQLIVCDASAVPG